MAIQVYKKAETVHEKKAAVIIRDVECVFLNITINELNYHLERGYYKTPGEWDEVAADDSDADDSDEVNADVIRKKAKAAGIEGHEKKRIKTLMGELSDIQNSSD